ncbi:GNAT family N-acetyltransferase [Terriglobus tenax]|uniref:GNAT family N-acetyltransferase n=1 Tax=Terriglobus tenax TaxID=1111115 RepID=UPI0021E09222|nr:GNAT family N-acetyltransferase [Terriglobus tenax]
MLKLFTATNDALRTMPPQMREVLAPIQYRARQASYAAMYPLLEDRVLCLEDGTAVGRHLIHRGASEIRTVDIAVLPQYQRQGIGRASLQQLQLECGEARVSHTLSVAKGNPAETLYLRLGFSVTGADEMYLHMSYGADESTERETEAEN